MSWRPSNVRAWHRRLALVLGLFLLFQGISGAVTQYRFFLMGEVQPNFGAPAEGPQAGPEEVITAVRTALPDFRPAHVMYPTDSAPDAAVMVMGGYDAGKMDMSRMVTVDQYRGRVIADMPTMGSTGWVGLITSLHKWETWGVPGRIAITIIGLGSMGICLFGLWHYWQLRKVRAVNWLSRWHRRAGVFVGTVIFFVALTGTSLNLFNWYERSTGDLVTATNMREAMMQENPPPIEVGLGEAAKIAHEVTGYDRIGAFSPAGPHARQHWFAMTSPQLKRVDVLVDPQTGKATTKNSGLMKGGGGLRDWLYPVHTGYVFGEVGGLITAICGTILLFWGISGFLIWRRGRRMRKTAAA